MSYKSDNIICIILLILSCFIFISTLDDRMNLFGQYQTGQHQWLTGTTYKYSEEWLDEQPWNINFQSLQNPSSIEFSNISSRYPYVSYLPGYVLTIYFVFIIFGKASLSLIMGFNMVNHLIIAILLSIFVYRLLVEIWISRIFSFCFAIISSSVEILPHSIQYWHEYIFFADQAVILPFVLFICLELVKDIQKRLYSPWNGFHLPLIWLNFIQFFTCLYGLFADIWFFTVIVLVVYIKRLIYREFTFKITRDVCVFLVPIFISWGYFFIQLFFHPYRSAYISHIFDRSTVGMVGNFAHSTLWDLIKIIVVDHVIYNYHYGIGIIWAALIFTIILFFYALFKCIKNDPLNSNSVLLISTMSLFFFPCVIQLFLGLNHSANHVFSVLKLSIPLSLVPFSLLPAYIILNVKNNLKMITFFVLLFFVLFGLYILIFSINSHSYIGGPQNMEPSKFLLNNTGYSDIVFSPNYYIEPDPPQNLSISKKRVYLVKNISEISQLISSMNIVNQTYRICIFYANIDDLSIQMTNQLPKVKYEQIVQNNFTLIRFSNNDSLNLVKGQVY